MSAKSLRVVLPAILWPAIVLATPHTVSAAAQSYDLAAFKDATLMRATVLCPDAPDNDCYQHRLGTDTRLKVSTSGQAIVTAIIGFMLPDETAQKPGRVDRCVLTMVGLKNPSPRSETLYVKATSPAWDEASVNAMNGPSEGNIIGALVLPANSSPQPIDVTPACKVSASLGSGFSVLVTTPAISYFEFPSKDAGQPARLQVDVH
ncbi:hypothetical protein [Nocardia sp. NPDC057440]|uniref:CBM96 family carbohydrate-binding protein n=1 Tax=Nocardia sp. NPDC057440 TaxID=3346134 RepID=UPI00366B6DC1